ncbi:thioredoxin TrxC [Rhizobium sp. P40RR-XXII]|nr:thioredoxin TrxC [Rhizobium sp. P40RR-XXII]
MPRIVPCPRCGQSNRLDDGRNDRAARCSSCRSALFTGRPVSLISENFARQISSQDLPVVVDFWASWCGPCQAMAPILEDAASRFEPRIRFAKVDTQAEPELTAAYGIRAIPTLIMFKGGKEIARRSGAMASGQLRQWLEQYHLA